MKNTFKKMVISTMIAVTTFAATLAPAATTVMANDENIKTYYTADGDMFFFNSDTGKYYYADADGIRFCNKYGIPNDLGTTSSLDKSQAGETRYANVSDFLALRSGPSTDNEMIAKLAPNAQVTIIGTTGSWAKVYAPSVDRDGYVSVNYLSKTKRAESKSSSEKAAYGDATYKKVFGTTNYLALRTDTKYDDANEIAKLHDGDKVQVIEFNVNGSGYALVYAPSVGKTGYVNNGYLR